MEFVNFSMAKKLKEKGFREECLCHYVGDYLIYNIESPIANNQLWFSHNKYDNIWHKDNVDAPTISQVLKWLREEKNIFVVVFIDDNFDYLVTYNIFKGADCVYHHHEEYFTLSEWSKCEIAGIGYCLDNLI